MRKEDFQMKGTIKLCNPIMINGKSVNTLSYDTNEITAAAFAQADSKKVAQQEHKGNLAGAVELDYALHIYLGYAAITAVSPEVDMSDLERIKGPDVIDIMKIGRNFITESSEERSDPELSEDVSEISPEPFSPQPQSSESNG